MTVAPRDSWFSAARYGTGYTFTLPSRLAHALHVAQENFGPRDKDFTILGVEFGPHDHPLLWYPTVPPRSVIVQLSHLTGNEEQAAYQLAHEAVHLLCPPHDLHPTVLEEGVATWFAGQYMQQVYGIRDLRPDTPAYARAQAIVAPLLRSDPGAVARLRVRQPQLSKATRGDLLAVWPHLTAAELDVLLTTFDAGRTL